MLGKGIKPCAAAERTEVAHRAADSRVAHAFYRLTTVTANLGGEVEATLGNQQDGPTRHGAEDDAI